MKSLTLKHETLSELADTDLVRVLGAAPTPICPLTQLTPKCTAPTI